MPAPRGKGAEALLAYRTRMRLTPEQQTLFKALCSKENVPHHKETEPFDGTDVPPMMLVLCRFVAWVLSGRCMILDRDDSDKLVPLKPRVGQWLVIFAMMRQAKARRPIRVIIPKYRRHGISTICQALFYFISRTVPHRHCVMAAHTEKAATDIFHIAKVMHEAGGRKLTQKSEASKSIGNPAIDSDYLCVSGAGAFAASGSTINCLHVSELAKFKTTSAQDRTAMNSMLNAVSSTSTSSIIVIESSGQGDEGIFPERCKAAFYNPERSDYECVFLTWLMDPALREDEDGLPDEFDPPLAGDEIVLREVHKATDGQLWWRRRRLWDDYRDEGAYFNTPPEFGWEFPTVFEDCFGTKSGRIYPQFGSRNYGTADETQLGPRAYRTRFIDWGGSEDHAFVCLWCLVDPDKPPQLLVDPNACQNFVKEHSHYARDPRTGGRKKVNDHCCDAFRIGVATLSIQCFVCVYRELYITNPADAVLTTVARTIHQMSGWVHPSGDPNHPDISAYVPSVDGERYSWGGASGDARYDWSTWREDVDREFQRAIAMGAGVADAAQYRNCIQLTEWGIPLVPHVKPPGPTKEGHVEDGISMVNILIAGDVRAPGPRRDPRRLMAQAAEEKLSRNVIPTDEEFEALRRDQFGGLPNDESALWGSTGWDLIGE